MTPANPKIFISYSWTSESHKEWVISLARELCENGVDVILDRWELKEGHDAHKFMEKMVNDPEIKKVALICDRIYAEKANERSGGVGTETQIITAEIYTKHEQTKFVAVIPEHDEKGQPFLPVYYKSRVYIDLSNPDLYGQNFEQLLRWIYDKPLHVKPNLGQTPAFLNEEAPPGLETASKFRRVMDAIRQNQPYCQGAISEYFETFTKNLELFRIKISEEEFDDKLVRNIEEFLPYRNEAIEVFLALARYRKTDETWEALHKFFETLIPYISHPEQVTSWREKDFDNFRFIIHELFIYAIAALLRNECFTGVAYLLRQYYFTEQDARYGGEAMLPFSRIRNPLSSLDHRNKRLNLRRLSLHADFLEQRSKTSAFPFQQVMQADFILFIRDCIDCLNPGRSQEWWPESLVYSERIYGPFEIFARSQSRQYFDKVKVIFDIETKENLVSLMEAFQKHKLWIPTWQYHSINPYSLMALDKMTTLP